MQQGQDGIHKLPLMMWSPLFWFGGQFGAPEQTKSVESAPKSASVAAPMQGAMNLGGGVMKASAQATSEMMGLMTRRSQAVMAFAADAAKCRAPQDLIGLQMKFWQTALQQHTEAARRMAGAWNIALPQIAGAADAPVRDRITFAEADTAGALNGLPAQQGRTTRDDRRSAA
jgi:hypothetical protein